MKDFKVFDLRFGFLVKNCVVFTPGTPKTCGGEVQQQGGVINWTPELTVVKIFRVDSKNLTSKFSFSLGLISKILI